VSPFAWSAARTIREAAAAATTTVADAMCSTPSGGVAALTGVVKAGGVDLLDLLKERLLAPAVLVGLAAIPGLDRIEEQADGGVRVGAMVTLAHLGTHAVLRHRCAALCDAVQGAASDEIRHLATLGGNLLQRPRCWYFRAAAFHCLRKGGTHCPAIDGENQYHAIFDNRTCPIVHPSTAATALVALDAAVELTAADGGVRKLGLVEFLVRPERDVQRENDLRPHEILTAVMLPPQPAGVRMAHVRHGEKGSYEWPIGDVAVVLDLAEDGLCRHASVVLGAAAPVPHRASSAEAVLTGRRIDADLAAEAARAATDGATPLSGNAYKLPLFRTLVRRAIEDAIARG
jgi:xanthine dehydrogenase YagS FAD-binding subunit